MSKAGKVLPMPTTEQVRRWWVQGRSPGVTEEQAGEQFDRWLAFVRRDALCDAFNAAYSSTDRVDAQVAILKLIEEES